jgi:1,4-dihydroxy-2-naphthoate octaprenyltransferase
LRATRAFSFPVSVLPVLVAVGAVLPPGQWRWDVLIASATGVGLLHAAGNVLNDLFDLRSGVDHLIEDPGRTGRMLVRGEVTPRELWGIAIVCGLAGLAAGGYVAWVRGPVVLAFAAVAALGAWAYTGPPLKLKYRAMGEGVIFLVFGPAIMLGAAYAQTGQWEGRAAVLSVPIGMVTTAVLVGNNLRDRREDRAAGIRTLAHLAGGEVSRWLYVSLTFGAVILLAVLAGVGVLPWPLLAAPLLLILLAGPLAGVWRRRRIPDVDARTARFAAAVGLAVLAACAAFQ